MEKQMIQPEWMQVAEIEIHYKSKVKPSQRPVVNCSSEIYQVLLKTWDENTIELQEHFKVLLLNRTNKVLGIYNCSQGGVSGTVADPKLILAVTVKSGACAFVIAHNHPSGSLKPSFADEVLTEKIKCAARYFDIRLLDHIIVTSESYFSFADEGIL